jgi:hypothetical protein
VVAEEIEDISWMLDDLLREVPVSEAVHTPCKAGDQP